MLNRLTTHAGIVQIEPTVSALKRALVASNATLTLGTLVLFLVAGAGDLTSALGLNRILDRQTPVHR